ncbi:MAG: response regulator transcription factor [Bacteroidia bacterium]
MKKKIILFEDNKRFAESLQMFINTHSEIECTKVYNDAIFIVEAVETHKPDLILMDIDMPQLSGIEALMKLRKTNKEVLVLMQTVFDNDIQIYNSILAGANGYILKKSSPQEYIAFILEVLNGGAPMSPFVAGRVLHLLQNPPTKLNIDFNLTPKETDVLRELVEGKSYKMIAAELDVTYHTVNSHVKKIYEKLHVNSATEAVRIAINSNLFQSIVLFYLATAKWLTPSWFN